MDPLQPEIAEAVTKRVLRALDELEAQAPQDPTFAPVFDEFRGLTRAGGKRVRPVFLSWGYAAAGGDDTDVVVSAGTALELVHLCALVHDDIMDGSSTRRGRRTPHLTFAEYHGSEDWTGDPVHFGEAAAIMVGDLALVLADRLMARAATNSSAWHEAFGHFTEMRLEVVMGQYLDLVEGHRRRADSATALHIAELKTAKYTVERPLLVGAALAQSTEDLDRTLSAFGVPVGIAFQFRDDLLGAFGDESVTGKPVGIDFHEGKQTYLVARLHELGSPAQRDLVDSRLGRHDLDDGDVDDLREVLVESGAVDDVERRIDSLVAQGIGAIHAGDTHLPDEVATALTDLANLIAYRDA